MTLEHEMSVLRGACGITEMTHVALFRISGDDAYSLLDALSSRPLFLRENQTCHTLFLTRAGGIYADVFISSGEDGYYLYAEGPKQPAGSGTELTDEESGSARTPPDTSSGSDQLVSGYGEQNAASDGVSPSSDARQSKLPHYQQALSAYLSQAVSERALASLHIEDLSQSHELWSLNGPFAWEVVSAVLGPTILGMPYLTMLHANDVLCFRAGKTGEFGYDLLIPKEQTAALRASLVELGAPLGLEPIGVAALDLGALENWHFCIRTLRESRLVSLITPIEMQLQWRISYDRDAIGVEALRAHRENTKYRAVLFCSTRKIDSGQSILLNDEEVGEVLAASWSYTRGEFVGIALLPVSLAHPRLTFIAKVEEGEATILTQTPPLLNNLSLHVDPHKHSFRSKHTETFPALVSR